MSQSISNLWLPRFAAFTALVTLTLIAVGGLVTSHGAGMAVPDWPNSYGYNMFLFPVSKWVGGIFYEHTHRVIASVVGLLVVALTRWLGGVRSRIPLAIIGAGEMLVGFAILKLAPDWKAAGGFLTGIGGVVLGVAAVWARNEPAARPLPALGWLAFVAVQIQGLLGGLRVVLFKDQIGLFHATLAQLFFLLLCAIALLTSRFWCLRRRRQQADPPSTPVRSNQTCWGPVISATPVFATLMILLQLVIGATMRHQHAGLAIPDFPLAYGKIWPAMNSAAVDRYNQNRLENTAVNPITCFQVGLQMAHRILGLGILALVALNAWNIARQLGRKSTETRLGFLWLFLVLLQATLGAATIWSDKAADIATAHVVVGALLLANGGLLCIISRRRPVASVALLFEHDFLPATNLQPSPAGVK